MKRFVKCTFIINIYLNLSAAAQNFNVYNKFNNK